MIASTRILAIAAQSPTEGYKRDRSTSNSKTSEKQPILVYICSSTPAVAKMGSKTISEALAAFVAERDWEQFHTPENLAKSVVIEAAELLECFQWGEKPDPQHVQEELADVLTYCFMLADRIQVDPEKIVLEKLEKTRKKYPVEKAKGSSRKYNELDHRPT